MNPGSQAVGTTPPSFSPSSVKWTDEALAHLGSSWGTVNVTMPASSLAVGEEGHIQKAWRQAPVLRGQQLPECSPLSLLMRNQGPRKGKTWSREAMEPGLKPRVLDQESPGPRALLSSVCGFPFSSAWYHRGGQPSGAGNSEVGVMVGLLPPAGALGKS